MNELAKQQKISRFLADTEMAAMVKDVLLATFLKPTKKDDVQYLAASRIAIDMLQDGFKALETYRSANRERATPTQPGL